MPRARCWRPDGLGTTEVSGERERKNKTPPPATRLETHVHRSFKMHGPFNSSHRAHPQLGLGSRRARGSGDAVRPEARDPLPLSFHDPVPGRPSRRPPGTLFSLPPRWPQRPGARHTQEPQPRSQGRDRGQGPAEGRAEPSGHSPIPGPQRRRRQGPGLGTPAPPAHLLHRRAPAEFTPLAERPAGPGPAPRPPGPRPVGDATFPCPLGPLLESRERREGALRVARMTGSTRRRNWAATLGVEAGPVIFLRAWQQRGAMPPGEMLQPEGVKQRQASAPVPS
uniref:proline-rich protein HaeIII subfamily 1-like isoform X2 n=1 Tax=Callithrix jacchus TaxID=9483 RepID=UPI0023DCFD7B|nr:proline-rich protein HaeIII subfamily 1-like isoform X2 [Callithrix jacchus]XP_035137416.2 proline-rich protein HaeIII subfamily 1-like isoform X2 [Callithrix jacchus]XP_054104368.1 proline-rich protein HaeIII subfamily 1-like isoform X2 [Callithrix jacchus]XP_054104369.1 proline-rich protein HaeIII subfamily 1-like isoform X2 [Callithrix jacchus]